MYVCFEIVNNKEKEDSSSNNCGIDWVVIWACMRAFE